MPTPKKTPKQTSKPTPPKQTSKPAGGKLPNMDTEKGGGPARPVDGSPQYKGHKS